jgi:hypothetical protein
VVNMFKPTPERAPEKSKGMEDPEEETHRGMLK